ncbi:trk system potassium uptake protein [Candidatus Magnetomoraceae bacterium gMMP-1]
MKVIIIGAGEVGFHIASRLAFENKEVVVIDKNDNALRRISESIDVQVFKGSGSSPEILNKVGIQDADILLAVTDSDETNLVACLFTDLISPSVKKLVRLRNAEYTLFYETLQQGAPHIDTLINPDIEAVKTIERLMSVPGAVDVSEFANGRIKLIGIRLDETSPVAGLKLMDLPQMKNNGRMLIAGVIRNEKLIIPSGMDKLTAGDLVYFICDREHLDNALIIYGKCAEIVRRVLIVGGGRIGERMAVFLESQSIYTKLIEKEPDRCIELARELNKTIVLQGDGSDQEILREENIQDMDLVITLTGSEEINILASLLAKRMGARKTITRISKFSYLPLVEAIDIEHVVSPRLSAVNTILQHIRKGNVLSAISIKGEQAEVLEAVALENSTVVGKPLKNLSFPKGALVIGIIRGNHTIIPKGNSVIEPMDKIIIFAVREAIQKVEKNLTVKLKYF